jgi:hypothetical protein
MKVAGKKNQKAFFRMLFGMRWLAGFQRKRFRHPMATRFSAWLVNARLPSDAYRVVTQPLPTASDGYQVLSQAGE